MARKYYSVRATILIHNLKVEPKLHYECTVEKVIKTKLDRFVKSIFQINCDLNEKLHDEYKPYPSETRVYSKLNVTIERYDSPQKSL